MLSSRPFVSWGCLLLAGVCAALPLAAQTEAPEQQDAASSWKSRLADPAFRQRVEHADGVADALLELDIPAAEQPAFYEWLRGQVRPPAEHKIECLLRAHLARQLGRPAAEISTADDLLLQAAPGFPQGWFGRAEQYESGTEKEAAAWAAEAAVQGMRKVNLASPKWQAQLHGHRGVDWLEHAVKAGHLTEWTKGVIHALEEAPHGRARPDACRLVLALLRHAALRQEPLLGQMLLEAVASAQPQLALGDPAGFAVTMRDLRAVGQAEVARRIARLLVFAPHDRVAPMEDPQQTAFATDLRTGFSELLGLWEDTTPPHQPATQAWLVLQTAMGEDGGAFAEECLQAAQTQPWNENLITHALLALALNGGVSAEQMGLAAQLGADGRARVALRLAAFAPPGSHPQATSGPWMEELALGLIDKMQNDMRRASFESFLNCLEGLHHGGEQPRLARVLAAAAAKNAAPRLDDLDHWERYARLALGRQDPALTHSLAVNWSSALDQTSQQKLHLLPLARAAIHAGRHGGAELAMLALALWERHHAEMTSTALPPPGEAARVGEALMASDHLEGFSRFVKGLENLQKHRMTSVYAHMTQELAGVRDLLEGKGDAPPGVECWVRPPDKEGAPATVQWQFVLPEFSASPERPIIVTTGDRDASTPEDRLSDARWWRAGAVLPALARLGGRWTLDVHAGVKPTDLRPLATVPEAPARGAQEVMALPAAGYVRVVLHRAGEVVSPQPGGDLRPYSTFPALFANGPPPMAVAEPAGAPVPDLTAVPQPASWGPDDFKRWGRVIAPPVEIQEATEYLLSEWPTQPFSNVRMILLDAGQRPLGPVPVASMGWTPQPSLTQAPRNGVWRQRLQRFRPGDWAGDGDIVFPSDGRAGEEKPRFIAFVTREPLPKPLPLLQLRPYEAGPGPALLSTAPHLPELNDEYIGDLGFSAHAWHVTFASDRGIITGKGALAGFDVMHIPWKPLVRADSPLIEGNEWPMCFTQEHCMVIEPSWKGTRSLGLRFVPFDARGERYAGCRRLELPLPTYSRGEISEWMDGAVLMVSSQPGDHPEPACAWVETDGRCHVVPLPRPPLKGRPGMELAWWGPGGTLFTLHEDGLLFHMEHRDGLRLLSVEPGSPDDMPEGCTPGRSKRKRSWRLERPDVLAHVDKKTGVVLRRFHLPKPCEGTPMAFESRGYIILFTTEHEIIRVNPPLLEQ